MIQNYAEEIVGILFDHGFTAYFAGGWVRDYLMGIPTHEIDIATNAPPEQIETLFPKTILVGKEFGVVVVAHGGHNFEVTTFRKDLPYHDGRHPTGIDYSTAEKDAQRRDFTINGMFYDPRTQEIHDYVGGKEDLEKKIIRAIGNPRLRFEEDRLRMIRAVRFSARFGFEIEKETKQAIINQAPTLLPAVSMERIWQELVKMTPNMSKAIALLDELGLLEVIFKGLKLKREALAKTYPKETPTIVYLLELFPEATVEICRYLKTSCQEMKLAEFFIQSRTLLKKGPTPVEWAHFYAHPHADLFIAVQGVFLKEHEERKKKLAPHIKRIQEKKPLVTAGDLQKKGIEPGKKMGELLKEAEKIAIEQDLHDSQTVIEQLKWT